MPDEAREDRRRFLKQAGTVVWATPLILTLGASAAQAISPDPCGGEVKPSGCPCVGGDCGGITDCCCDTGAFSICMSVGDCAGGFATCK